VGSFIISGPSADWTDLSVLIILRQPLFRVGGMAAVFLYKIFIIMVYRSVIGLKNMCRYNCQNEVVKQQATSIPV
jgi:hypothetical protein